jgi:chemotaxis response regulator CheB
MAVIILAKNAGKKAIAVVLVGAVADVVRGFGDA